MEDKELIKEMYYFSICLAQDLKEGSFGKHRDRWNILMDECENKLNMR